MKRSTLPFILPGQENTIYTLIAFIFCLIYVGIGFALPFMVGKSVSSIQDLLFGFSQFRFLTTNVPFTILMFLFIGIALLIDKIGVFIKLSQIHNNAIPVIVRIVLSLLSVGLFFFLRNNFINPDGTAFADKFLHDVPLIGAHVTHDEMWELYFHSRFWFYTNHYLGWSVEFSYQILSCLAGGIFVFLLLTYCSKFFEDTSLFAFLMCVSGGYIQLFFGDIENYTLTIVWIMGYFFASALFSEKKVSIVVPSVLLAIALTFHLLVGFLIPSLIFLYLISWKRGEKQMVIYGMVSFSLIIVFTLLFFHLNGLP